MKRFIFVFLASILLVFSCGPSYVLTNDFDYKFSDFRKVDSVCVYERLPRNWNKYNHMTMGNDSISFDQYVYVKRTDSTEVIYTLTDLDSLWRVKKKTVKIYK